jgi:Domain of unknown function (DUF4258)
VEIRLHFHAKQRLVERGASEAEVVQTVETGEPFAAKYGRQGFRRAFAYNGMWQGRTYATKQVEAIAVREADDWLVITVLVKYF